jgi:hypothetical protein
VIETNREILTYGKNSKEDKPTHTTNPCDKSVLVCEEAGMAHSSVEDSVKEIGAKEPYLVDVNREARACTLLVLVRMGLHFASACPQKEV